MKQPLIKWTGSKRKIAEDIIYYLPKNIKTYYEPFLGGGSVFLQLLKNNHNVEKYILSDINKNLIDIFNFVKNDPKLLIEEYENHWYLLKADKNYYYQLRDEFNTTKNSILFYFLTRTAYNGTIRFNSKGEFNTSLHFNRDGIKPETLKNIINYYHNLMKNKDISFNNFSFSEINPKNNDDVVFLDPPYSNSDSLYFGNIDIKILENFINNLNCNWFMTFNGTNEDNNIINDKEHNFNLNYDNKILLKSGKSSFSKLKNKDVLINEYFYVKNKT
jgi:DNA adenine methylase